MVDRHTPGDAKLNRIAAPPDAFAAQNTETLISVPHDTALRESRVGTHARTSKMFPRLSVLCCWVIPALLCGLSSSWALLTSASAGALRHASASHVAARLHRSSLRMTAGSSPAIKEGAVIVGGGPSGLATALMLAKRGWTDISVLERTPSADFFDPLKAFV